MRSHSGDGGSLSMRPVRSGNGSTTGGVGVVRPSGDQRSSKGGGAGACLCSSGPEAEGEAERLSRAMPAHTLMNLHKAVPSESAWL